MGNFSDQKWGISAIAVIPAVFVRKVAKTHGTARLAEGPPVEGKRLLIVEDVVTSGGQIRLSASASRALGASVLGALCVVDREEGGSENLAEDGIVLRSLFRASEHGGYSPRRSGTGVIATTPGSSPPHRIESVYLETLAPVIWRHRPIESYGMKSVMPDWHLTQS